MKAGLAQLHVIGPPKRSYPSGEYRALTQRESRDHICNCLGTDVYARIIEDQYKPLEPDFVKNVLKAKAKQKKEQQQPPPKKKSRTAYVPYIQRVFATMHLNNKKKVKT